MRFTIQREDSVIILSEEEARQIYDELKKVDEIQEILSVIQDEKYDKRILTLDHEALEIAVKYFENAIATCTTEVYEQAIEEACVCVGILKNEGE